MKETEFMMANTQKEMLLNDIAECESMIRLLIEQHGAMEASPVSLLTSKLRKEQVELSNLELQKRMIGSGDIIMPI
jgi:hypothetical protein